MTGLENLRRIQKALLLLVGVGALFGGGMAIVDPSGALYGAPVEMLRTGPFTDFLIPGLFLFFVLGCGHLVAYLLVKRETRFHAYISGIAGGILMAWIVIQCYILQAIAALHVIFFLVGLIESLISLAMLLKQQLFPFKNQLGNYRLW